jgi:hypothetical protein
VTMRPPTPPGPTPPHRCSGDRPDVPALLRPLVQSGLQFACVDLVSNHGLSERHDPVLDELMPQNPRGHGGWQQPQRLAPQHRPPSRTHGPRSLAVSSQCPPWQPRSPDSRSLSSQARRAAARVSPVSDRSLQCAVNHEFPKGRRRSDRRDLIGETFANARARERRPTLAWPGVTAATGK